jgi:hypothetical protein
MNDMAEENGSVLTTERVPSSSYGESIDSPSTVLKTESVVMSTDLSDATNVHQNGKTYIEIVASKDESGQPMSVLEVDLIISREKGKENRRLAMNFAEIDVKSKQILEKSVNIDQESFRKLKEFFSNLDWNS